MTQPALPPDGGPLDALLDARLQDIVPARRRRRRLVDVPDITQPTRVVVDGRPCVAFCSNDYLGLAAHPQIIEAFAAAARRHGVGSGASHLVSGHGPEHEALETELADFMERPRALVFSTGYMANLGIASALVMRHDGVFEDRLNHASLLDAGLGSRARFSRYDHGNAEALRGRLTRHASRPGSSWVFTDGVFSMDGDVAPLRALATVAREHHAHLVVDDAHGIGVLGPQGRGSVAAAGLDLAAVPVVMGTLGKALGTAGAFVAGSEQLIETLIQKARTYIYTTALPPAVAAATRTALRLTRAEEWRRERLRDHVQRFRTRALDLGLALAPSETPIQPVILGSDAAAVAASRELLDAGFFVSAIRPPTVPEGSARLRFTFSAAHTDTEVTGLLDALGRLPALRASA